MAPKRVCGSGAPVLNLVISKAVDAEGELPVSVIGREHTLK